MPVLLRYIDRESGLTATSLLDMPNINSSSTAQQIHDACNKVRETFSLDPDNRVTYSSGNENYMVG